MKALLSLLPLVAVPAVALMAGQPAGAKQKTAAHRTGLARWRAADGDFAGWALDGVRLNAAGALEVNPHAVQTGEDPAGAYDGGNFYNGGGYRVGEATSPEIETPFAFREVIPSWNATTPVGTWLEIQVRVCWVGRWTKWYNLGVWEADSATVVRHSVKGQGDADGHVAADTLILTDAAAEAKAFQIKLRLFSADGQATPVVRNVFAAYSTPAPQQLDALSDGAPVRWNTRLNVPAWSQMVYPDGGDVWCSPTSVAMVLAYWQQAAGPAEPRVRAAVAGVYDPVFGGHGNWPFNTAYAATQPAHGAPLEGFVRRFTSLEAVEAWAAAGVPVIVSFAWQQGDLTGAAIPTSNGHLAVLVGFDAAGNPIVNDPAAAADADVPRTYPRREFETVWLTRSGGAVYLIYPEGWKVPE